MIKLNGHEVKFDYFPDGTPLFNSKEITDVIRSVILYEKNRFDICWNYEYNEEMVWLYFLVSHLKEVTQSNASMRLYMPYIPNARQDRVKSINDMFTLKHFAKFINSLGFKSVHVLDPHSPVSEALIDNLHVDSPRRYIDYILRDIPTDGITIFYPDEGAMKRYSGLINRRYAFGIKNRDWATGKINGLSISGDPKDIKDRTILIVDDICCRGGTFFHSAEKLKEMGAGDIYLYVTHCERAVLDADLLRGNLIEKLYTTDSIFTNEVYEIAKRFGLEKKIEVIKFEY